MAALDLPTGPGELLTRTRTVLSVGVGGESHLVLGGATALIARWHHRDTHDSGGAVFPVRCILRCR